MSSHKEANDYMLIESGRKYNGELHKIKLGIFLIQPTAFEHAFWALCMGAFGTLNRPIMALPTDQSDDRQRSLPVWPRK